MRSHIKFILPLIILVFTSNLIGQTVVEGSEEGKFLKIDLASETYYKGELFNGKQLGYYENGQPKRNQCQFWTVLRRSASQF